MPTYTDRPPAPDAERALPIRRTPANGQIVAAVTSLELLGTNTHFFGGHTVPCEAPDCEACGKGIPWRWHGYVAAIQAKTRMHFIFEFTAQAGEIFRDFFTLNRTLRGCVFSAERMHHRPNGRVILNCKPGDLAQLNLPEPPDLQACLAIIWHLPIAASTVSLDGNQKPIIHVDKNERILREKIGSSTRPHTGAR